MNRSGKNYTIPVSNGIFDHRRRIGAAIWEFMWLVDHTTKEVLTEGGKFEGLVLGSQPVSLSAIASDLKLSWHTVREHLEQLAAAGYVRKITHGNGRPNGYAVVNSKRFANRRVKANKSNTPIENPMATLGENPTGTYRKIPQDLSVFPPGPIGKHPHIYKERHLQDNTRHNSTDDVHSISPDMIAAGVCDDLGLSGADLMRTIGDVAKSELKQGKTPDEIRNAMTKAWCQYSTGLINDEINPEYATGPDTFFGKGKWRNQKTWRWREGHKPKPNVGRRYATEASA